MESRVNGCGMIRSTLSDPELGRPLHTADNVAVGAAHGSSGDEQRSGGSSLGRCLRHTFVRPLCCFPSAVSARPSAGHQNGVFNRLWLPPILGLAPIFWLTLFATIGVGAAAQYYWKPVLLTVFVLLGYLISVALHEFAHAAVAFWGGDLSVMYAGYLTLDYLRYISPVYSLGLPLLFLFFGGIALPGAAVRIQVENLRNKKWETLTALGAWCTRTQRDRIYVTSKTHLNTIGTLMWVNWVFSNVAAFRAFSGNDDATGPLANLLLGFVASGIFHVLLLFGLPGYTLLHAGLTCIMYFSAMSVILSLIPLPPFDGWAALSPWLSDRFFLKVLMRNPVYNRLIQLLVVAALLPLYARVEALSDAVLLFTVRIFRSPLDLTVKAVYYFYLPYREWLTLAAPYTRDFSASHTVPLSTGGV